MPRQKNTKPSHRNQENEANQTDNPVPNTSNDAIPSTSGTTRSQRSSSENRTSSRITRSETGNSRRSRSEERGPRIQSKMLREIARLQRTTNLLIPKLPFARLIREVLLTYNHQNLRITSEALMALQESTELYAVQLMQDAYRCTLHRDRVTLMPKDLRLALYLREKW